MKKYLFRLLSLCVALLLLIPPISAAAAQEPAVNLNRKIKNSEKRHFVETMLNFHLQENTMVQQTLEEGYSAVFFFEGCSDNMDDPELSDLSYYRVSAVCIVLALDRQGKVELTYFNDACSTLPDRPLEYGAWYLEEIGEVGPATVCDGTYELYSVYHSGSYEALHLRTSYEDDTIAAVYMMPEGFVTSAADAINIHTRTGNHVIEKAMWSAGCMLVGDGDFQEFTDLIEATYYSNYRFFYPGQRVGCVTINRQQIQQQMYELYQNPDAVDTVLASSRYETPGIYLERCTERTSFPERTVQAAFPTVLMSLPCGSEVDSRSLPVTSLVEEERINICGSIRNTLGEVWYEVAFVGENCYVPADAVEEIPEKTWFDKVKEFFSFL